MEDKFSVFGLTAEQSEVLFALQRKLTSNDVNVEGQKKHLLDQTKKGRNNYGWIHGIDQLKII